jgi:SAM-dependent methyltransferase
LSERTSKTPGATVEAGYDAISRRYLAWAANTKGEPTWPFVREFISRLPAEARVLDLGCGAGVPVTRELSKRFEVLGIDISQSQLTLARTNVPDATFIQRDMAELQYPPSSWHGVVALSSITHLPREDHEEYLHRLAGWLVPGGLLFASLGATAAPSATSEWLGVPMFYASYDAATNRALLTSAGLDLVRDEIAVTMAPGGKTGPELWVIAQKRATPPVPNSASATTCDHPAGGLVDRSRPGVDEDEHDG